MGATRRTGRSPRRDRAAEPDDAYVARLRPGWQTCMQVCGPPGAWDYRYAARLTGPGAASYPPPPEPEAGGNEL